MKWSKYRKLRDQYPWLDETIDTSGSLDRQANTKRGGLDSFRDMVRNKLTFIAFRPFERLDLDVMRNDGHDTAAHAIVTDRYYGGSGQALYQERWELVWHIGDHLDPFGYGIEWNSIRQKIEEVHQWHKCAFARRNEPVTFVRVLKWTARGNRPDSVGEISLEIFEFPPGWTFYPRSLKIPHVDPGELEATRAYLKGTAMPPIIPSV